MAAFDPSTSILAGMTDDQVRAALSAAQTAYLQLSSGAKVVTASYAQGDGTKSVTYTASSIGALTQLIRLCQAQLGIICTPRSPIRVIF